jgi:acetylornithine deacetylase/succinyl-diaminopimelate desuccinylase-like protein
MCDRGVSPLLAVTVAMAQFRPQASHEQLAFDIFKELVEIDTVTATGDTAKAAEAMGARLRAAGFDASDVHVFLPAPRKGNLVVGILGWRERSRRTGSMAATSASW